MNTFKFRLNAAEAALRQFREHGCPARITARRHAQPWYPAKTEPAFEDMLTQLRRFLIAARISEGSAARPTPEKNQSHPGSMARSRRVTAKPR